MSWRLGVALGKAGKGRGELQGTREVDYSLGHWGGYMRLNVFVSCDFRRLCILVIINCTVVFLCT